MIFGVSASNRSKGVISISQQKSREQESSEVEAHLQMSVTVGPRHAMIGFIDGPYLRLLYGGI
jgi:hypothetical protein